MSHEYINTTQLVRENERGRLKLSTISRKWETERKRKETGSVWTQQSGKRGVESPEQSREVPCLFIARNIGEAPDTGYTIILRRVNSLSLPVALLLLTVMTNSWFIVFSYMSEGRGGEIQEGITVDLSVLVDQHRKQRQQSTIGYHFPVRGNGEVVSDFLNLLNIAIQDI